MNTQKTFLYIGAHPDDETQVAGTMALLAGTGFSVHVYIATPGRGGKPNDAELSLTKDEIVFERKKEAELFSQAIGGTVHVHNNGTRFLENNTEDVLSLVKYMRTIQPDIIVIQNDGDYHFEHINCRNLALQASEIASRSAQLELGEKIKDFVLLESDGLNVLANPMIYIDITQVYKRKQKAMWESYRERLGGLIQFDRGLAQMRGGRVGIPYAEAFSLINPSWYRMTEKAAESLHQFISSSLEYRKKHEQK